jgi:GntR family transcriptional regulator
MSKGKISDVIAAEMLKKIKNYEWRPQMRLPSEKVLSEQFLVSRNTLREALQILIDHGYIKRQHGSGSIVLPPAIKYYITDWFSISELIENNGYKSNHTGTKLEIEKPTEKLIHILKVSEFEPIYKITRIHTVDDNPAVFEYIFTPAYTLPGITTESFKNSIQYTRDRVGLPSAYADCVIKATRPPREVAKALGQESIEPLLLLISVVRDINDNVLSYVEDYFSDWFEFPIRRVRTQLGNKNKSK